ncbi:protealysin inhibitor emfourin [Streptomyces sp. NPDC047014]|uniref:protealysin inhibitor emfourin n=1 Tax=Streptomyces sp. NPDC047014 TaxID=3155736 RepID=UPI0033EAB33F
MLITVIRTGGFAGGERTASLETECRPDGPALERLAERALADEGPVGRDLVPDAFGYVVHIDGKVVDLQDPYLTEAQQQLVDAVLAEAA